MEGRGDVGRGIQRVQEMEKSFIAFLIADGGFADVPWRGWWRYAGRRTWRGATGLTNDEGGRSMNCGFGGRRLPERISGSGGETARTEECRGSRGRGVVPLMTAFWTGQLHGVNLVAAFPCPV